MAGSTGKILKRFSLSIIASLIVICIIFSIIIAIILNLESISFNILNDYYINNIILSTILQSVLSTIITIVIAIPIARAFHRRRRFFLRNFLLRMYNLSFIMPAIILVFSLNVVHGNNGFLNKFLNLFNMSLGHYLYGIIGIILGHVTFNLPLATKLFLYKIDLVHNNIWKLSSNLGMSSKEIFLYIEFPMLKPIIASVSLIIFIMCFTSFTIVISLGGTSGFATIEASIYQALKFEFDLPRAVILSSIQLIICFVLFLFAMKYVNYNFIYSITEDNSMRPDLKSKSQKYIDVFFIALSIFLMASPIMAVLYNGINHTFFNVIFSYKFWMALEKSMFIALFSGFISIILSVSLLSGSFLLKYYFHKERLSDVFIIIGNLPLITSPFILATGLFILLRSYSYVLDGAVYIIILMNALLCLPFVMGILSNSFYSFDYKEICLCKHLGIDGWNFIYLIAWKYLRKPIGFAFATAVTISWGDLGAAALFGNKDVITLPLLLYYKMNSYNINEASVISLIMMILSFYIFWSIEKLLGADNHAKT